MSTTVTRETVTIHREFLHAHGPVGKALQEAEIMRHVKEEIRQIREDAKKQIDDLFSRIGVAFIRNVDPDSRCDISIQFQTVEPE